MSRKCCAACFFKVGLAVFFEEDMRVLGSVLLRLALVAALGAVVAAAQQSACAIAVRVAVAVAEAEVSAAAAIVAAAG